MPVNWVTTSATTTASYDVQWIMEPPWSSSGNNAGTYFYNASSNTVSYSVPPIRVGDWIEPTEEERAAAAAARERRREVEAQRNAEAHRRNALENDRRLQASMRAVETLLRLLTPEQVEQYERERYIIQRGSLGGWYRIHQGYAQNIYELDDEGGRPVSRLCAHPRMNNANGTLPIEDAMIAQLLQLRFDEPGFLAVANRSRV